MQIAVLSQPDVQNEEIQQAILCAGMQPVMHTWRDAPETWQACSGVIVLDAEPTADALNLLKQKNALGDPILGLGEGARALIESGWVPGVEGNKAAIKWVQGAAGLTVTVKLMSHYQYNAFTRYLTAATAFEMPAGAHENYFDIPPALLMEMQANGLAVFYYADSKKIAAVSNKAGNAMAIALPIEKSAVSEVIFKSMHDYLKKGYRQQVKPLYYYPRE